MSSTCTARDFAAAAASGTYRRAESAGDYIATNARAWIALADPKAALVLDDLLVLYALAYKYRCLWDADGSGVEQQENASDVAAQFAAFVAKSPQGWTKQQFDDNVREMVEDEMNDWTAMQDFMTSDVGWAMADVSRADRNTAMRATERFYAYAARRSSRCEVLAANRVRRMAAHKVEVDDREV